MHTEDRKWCMQTTVTLSVSFKCGWQILISRQLWLYDFSKVFTIYKSPKSVLDFLHYFWDYHFLLLQGLKYVLLDKLHGFSDQGKRALLLLATTSYYTLWPPNHYLVLEMHRHTDFRSFFSLWLFCTRNTSY